MALGFAPNLLQHMKVVAQNNYQGMKITPLNFLKMLIENNPSLNITKGGETINPLKRSTLAGHIRDIKLKYLPRAVASQVEELDDCDNNIMYHYTEQDITTPRFVKTSLFLDWQFVEKYQAEASQAVALGTVPAMGALQELQDQIMHSVNALVSKMDTQLMADVVWGTNAVSGNNAVTTLNIDNDSTNFDLSTGIAQMLYEAKFNELFGDVLIAGSGNMQKFELLKGSNAIALAQNGVNLASLQGYRFYWDINAATSWGTNQVGVFGKGNIGFVDIDRYIAWKTGEFGTSTFGTIELPVETTTGVPKFVRFNIQIKEIDCPTEIYNGYGTVTSDRGYQVIITKRYGLWQLPTDSVQATDRLTGVNGALRFAITNT